MFPSGCSGAVFFDVDGTLVPGTSSSAFLAGFLGHRDELTAAEDAYTRGAMDNRQVSELDAAGWAGVPEGWVAGWLDGLPLVPGITETVAWCRRNGLAPVLATLAWSPVGAHLSERFGFDAFSGPRLRPPAAGSRAGSPGTSTNTARGTSPSPTREGWPWPPAPAGPSATAAPTCRCSRPSG